jgi:hypothetical protein
MTRAEQLVFCKKCTNRIMDVKQGLICNLTGERANFQDTCPDFQRDDSVKEVPIDDQEGLATAELQQRLSANAMDELRMQQKLLPGIMAGVMAGIAGAALWGAITVATGYQIGFMALAVGAGVGIAVRKFGNGVDAIFGFWGAAIALLSVLLGNFLSIIGFIANSEGLGYFETLMLFDYAFLPQLMKETFSIIDIVFYALAIVQGYKYSFRVITEKDLVELRKSD